MSKSSINGAYIKMHLELDDLEQGLAKRLDKDAKLVTAAMHNASVALQADLRRQTEKAGLGKGLTKAWRRNGYPRKSVGSFGAKGVVWSKAPKLHDAFNTSMLVKAKRGRMLAIPTKHAPTKRRFRNRSPMTPDEYESEIGDLEYVKRGRHVFAIARLRKRTGKKGGWSAPSASWVKRNKPLASKILYVLIPHAKHKKLLDIEGAVERAERFALTQIMGSN